MCYLILGRSIGRAMIRNYTGKKPTVIQHRTPDAASYYDHEHVQETEIFFPILLIWIDLFLGSQDNKIIAFWIWLYARQEDHVLLYGGRYSQVEHSRKSLSRKVVIILVGDPRPIITWFKDGVELYQHRFFQVIRSFYKNVIADPFLLGPWVDARK